MVIAISEECCLLDIRVDYSNVQGLFFTGHDSLIC